MGRLPRLTRAQSSSFLTTCKHLSCLTLSVSSNGLHDMYVWWALSSLEFISFPVLPRLLEVGKQVSYRLSITSLDFGQDGHRPYIRYHLDLAAGRVVIGG